MKLNIRLFLDKAVADSLDEFKVLNGLEQNKLFCCLWISIKKAFALKSFTFRNNIMAKALFKTKNYCYT